ncbi:hypothetical protein Tco_0438970 [Tanacetum coccineum]
MYDSWKSRMELYIENRENKRMILNSVQHGLLVWPTIVKEDGTTRKEKYEELSAAEKLQAHCDLKATNIILQVLPPDVYSIINHHRVAKEIWDRVKLLMQGTKMSLQEKECKLYDEFDKFSFVKGETLPLFKMTGLLCNKFKEGKDKVMLCTKPKRLRNSAWFQEKMLLVQAQESGYVLDEEQLAFLVDLGIPDGQAA